MTKSTFLVFLLSLCFFPSLNAKPGKSPNILGLWKKVGVKCNLKGQCQRFANPHFHYITSKGKYYIDTSESAKDRIGFCFDYKVNGNHLTMVLCKEEVPPDNILNSIEVTYKLIFLDSNTMLQADDDSIMKLVRVK